jgi:translation initiation factor 2 subunit 3
MKNNKAKEQYTQIKKFAKNKNVQNSLIIPISAMLKFNLDVLIQYLTSIPIPKRDIISPPKFNIIHSYHFPHFFDDSTMLNKTGTLYGILQKGIFKLGDNVEILPGICLKIKNKEIRHCPIYGKITILQNEKNLSNYIIPGGLVNIGVQIDSEVCKNNKLEGCVMNLQEKGGNVYYKIGVKCHLLRKLIKIEKKEIGHNLEYVTDLKKGEVVLLNINFISVGGYIISIKGNNSDEICIELKRPICLEISDKIIISRKMGSIWRIIGWGEVISNGEDDAIIT